MGGPRIQQGLSGALSRNPSARARGGGCWPCAAQMNEWARGKYKGRANFVCVSCDGPELAQAMGERMKLKDCVNSVTASSRDGPYWGQLGCSGFIILSPGSQQVIAGKTMAF